MNRTTMTLIGAVTALAAVTGVAAVAAPGGEESAASAGAGRKPVERSTLVCPQPGYSDVAETAYTAFAPKGGEGKGAAKLFPAEKTDTDGTDDDKGKGKGKGGKKDAEDKEKRTDEPGDAAAAKPFLPLDAPGKPATATKDTAKAPALFGSADGRLAPGWTVQQTTQVSAGAGRGLQGTACAPPDTDFWFPGASTDKNRQDYVHLTNPDDTSAVVDLDLYSKKGKESTKAGEGITIRPHSTVPVLLSTLTNEPAVNVTLHVVARSGRVGAQVQAVDKKLGGDWISGVADPAPQVVLPGIPSDAKAVRLAVFAPGENDADLDVRLAGPSGQISPAGYETLHVRGGTTKAVDLRDLTKGEAGSLVLSPSEDASSATPVIAAVRVIRGKGANQETAFIPGTAPLAHRATAADNSGKGSVVSLTAPGKSATVRVTSSAGSGGGESVSKTYKVKSKTTRSLVPPLPKGVKGSYAVTVERLSGGPVHASRMLERRSKKLPAFTVQVLPDDRGTVSVPGSGQDLSVLTEGG
ncbi:hypothetical protein GCM10012287_32160 [Streptomyces daqingensis]|uniref:Secreted protein n=1 Tax=Streptomyces daqingensis TaxID=1472640 RepID=A0ABQ2MFY5_9ACTN|nr:DUF5719 family protein [Streptomyces daqingensis]GGO51031.1 hypothetical protein GCM10012287_32160 [Streptomyces daqingensis]